MQYITRPLLSLLLPLLLALASGLGQAQTRVEIKDDLGQTTHWSQPPLRIITLLPSLTETVCELGACDRLVGVDRYSNHPAAVNKLPKLGGLDDTQVETIVALKPDVVLLAPSSRVTERLRSLGLTVITLEAKSYADVQRVLAKIGALLQVKDAQAVWRRIDALVSAAAQSLPAQARGSLVYYEVDRSPYAAGPVSFMGETMARLGLRNIIKPEMGPFPKISPEYVVRANPQLIMIGKRNADGLFQRPGWERIPAILDKRVCVFDALQSDVLARPGPRMGEAAQIMAQCLRQHYGQQHAKP
ncbi:iron complex transport system substrate-binding protein [Paucibacter oligotrophus]|uniref:Iron complex transport system substrate-binding protein n=1 Tax=Roseateles oligotrophus TaxID=1769250 RepID=A0A840LDK6_9BURK|nr:helical backbone metal receptor [Roseateles oligotrophus]MBB4845781.1 iron complex transport system substrate-binding protein [Roseateles oligotrophus]